jgi:ABC-2 type transport system permease protein
VNAYVSLIAVRFKSSIQYRAAAVAGVVTQLFFGFITVMVMDAFYATGAGNPGMKLSAIVNYVWLGQAFLGMLPWNVDKDIQASIRNGNIVYDFIRPIDLYFTWWSNSLAWRVSSTILRAVPLLLFVSLVNPLLGMSEYALTAPSGATAFFAFIATYTLTICLSISITVFMNIVTLLFLSAEGLNIFINGIVTILSGMIIPLPLFPGWLAPFLFFQPFSGLVDFPFRYYSGDFDASLLALTIPVQLFWIAFFIVTGKMILSRVKKKLVVQGG